MQIPLALKLPMQADLEDFVGAQKQEITHALKHLKNAQEHHFIFLSGAQSTGKTLLLSAACQLFESHQRSVIYIPLKQANDFSPEICDDLETADIICLDDIDAIAGQNAWEMALFHLYNRLRDNNKQLIISSRHHQKDIPIVLPDLKSRLAWGISINLKNLDDRDKKDILQKRAKKLGMTLADDASNYLLRHHNRTLNHLLETLDELDHASLAAHRKLTVPFIKDFLTWHAT